MSKLKKLGKGLEDISYLFLSSETDKSPPKKDIEKPQKKEIAEVKTSAKSVCLIGSDSEFRDSFLVVNLALALARMGMRIAVVDMDENLPCLNFFLGRRVSFEELTKENGLIKKGPLDVQFVGLNKTVVESISEGERKNEIFSQLFEMEKNIDLIIVSISAKNLLQMDTLIKESIREFLVLVSPHKIKMLNTYRIIKAVFSYNSLAKIGMIITGIDHMYEIDAVYNKMSTAVSKFLDKELYKYGFLFKIKEEINATSNIASFYDADLTACISNIAQIIVLRLNVEESSSSRLFFKKVFADFSNMR